MTDVHMCKLFPELLVDHARSWFDSLPSGSIGWYEELLDAFNQRFFQKAAPKVTSSSLLLIRQDPDETISDFMTRFDKERLKFGEFDDRFIISAFQNVILPGPLHREIIIRNPCTATDLWCQV